MNASLATLVLNVVIYEICLFLIYSKFKLMLEQVLCH